MVEKKNIAVCIILSLVTCGIYMYYWIYTLTQDTNIMAGEQEDTSGGMVVLLTIVTCGIYGYYWAYKRGEKIDRYHRMCGESANNGGLLYLLLYIFIWIVALALMQDEVNKFADRCQTTVQ